MLHRIQVAIDSATPVDDDGSSGGSYMDNPPEASYGGYGPMRAYGRMCGSLNFDDVSIWTLVYVLNEILHGSYTMLWNVSKFWCI